MQMMGSAKAHKACHAYHATAGVDESSNCLPAGIRRNKRTYLANRPNANVVSFSGNLRSLASPGVYAAVNTAVGTLIGFFLVEQESRGCGCLNRRSVQTYYNAIWNTRRLKKNGFQLHSHLFVRQ